MTLMCLCAQNPPLQRSVPVAFRMADTELLVNVSAYEARQVQPHVKQMKYVKVAEIIVPVSFRLTAVRDSLDTILFTSPLKSQFGEASTSDEGREPAVSTPGYFF